ncbi:type I-E CRISPR-associated protein Cas7/Cse4/CasC [Kiritimatiella glycovorans]|uniref:CRISPR system Cascade subunit CasC n=1 Tax=Kiritimatiella glycovorans TaxID=1307763 RepID=A0A0G3EMH9_9BACT|nr:type I-E CRISPR-associated protein Cas7/Cse4/CasC [Kiritimatiella glycovorans]AKJ65309.1 CRISPR system Cascade subunit CasC [Kiritimatiella glycovorans]
MKTLELHILQSFPVSCLNRDDVGAPKTAVFGGVQRARVSSQCWKRAIRMMAKETASEFFGGDRTRYIIPALKDALVKEGFDEDAAAKAAEDLVKGGLGKKDKKHEGAVKTLFYITPMEVEALASAYCKEQDVKKKVRTAIQTLRGPVRDKDDTSIPVHDKADISIFGRMVADDHSLTLEGAGMFSHAISTHRVSNEIDFFTAVDDCNPEDIEGVGHMGANEFNSACYYRYMALNLDLLRSESHLGCLADEEFSQVIESFIRAALLAVPHARKNSMMGFNPPECVLGTVREGQPVSLANAFERTVDAGGDGYIENSVKRMKEKFEWMRDTYGYEPVTALWIPEKSLDNFCRGLVENV